MATILITGANGQLGQEIKSLSAKYSGFNFIFTDIEELNILDYNQLEKFFNKNKIDYVINCAAYTEVDKAEADAEQAYDVNVRAVENLVDIISEHKIKIIHISTDYVFDGENFKPYTEDKMPFAYSNYGKTKLKGEREIEQMGGNYIILRTSWLYSSFGKNFVKTMLKLGKEKPELNVIYDQIGTPTYAADLANTILEILSQSTTDSKKFISGTYHYSNEGVCSWYDFAKSIFEISNINCQVNPIESKDYPTPARRPHYSVLSKEKIKKTFGIQIPYWRDSLKLCLSKLEK